MAVSQSWDKIQQRLQKMDGWIYGGMEGGKEGWIIKSEQL